LWFVVESYILLKAFSKTKTSSPVANSLWQTAHGKKMKNVARITSLFRASFIQLSLLVPSYSSFI